MKKLSLKPNAFNKGEVLTRAQLKKVIGGLGSGEGPCDPPTAETCFNCCMAGYDEDAHTKEENAIKVSACEASC